MAKQSKQEKRLAKGLKSLSVMGDMVQALKNGEISPPEAQPEPAYAEATAADLGNIAVDPEVVAELPELVPDAPSPERTAPELAAEAPLTMAEQDARDAAAAAPTPPVAGPVLQVKQGLTLRGGRGEWYKLLCKYDGKPVADYIAAGKANPASHYTARSTKCGQPKTPESRLSWFKRAGIVTIK